MYQRGAEVYRVLLDDDSRRGPSDGIDGWVDQARLAVCLIRVGDIEEGRDRLREAAAHIEDERDPGHPIVTWVRDELSRVPARPEEGSR